MHGRKKQLSKPKTQKQSEENIIDSIRNLFILKKIEIKDRIIKDEVINDIRALFEKEEEKKGIKVRAIKHRIIRENRTHFEEEDYYKPKRVRNFSNNNHIKYESNGDRSKNLLLEEYFTKIKPYLRNIIIDLQESDTCKIQLTIAIKFIFSKDVEEECIMHSKSSNTELNS